MSSEECSIQNSLNDTQPDLLSVDRLVTSSRGEKTGPDSNMSFMPVPSAYKAPTVAQDLTFYNKQTNYSCSSEPNENRQTFNAPLEHSFSEDRNNEGDELLSNGRILSTTAALEGMVYVVASVRNDIEDSCKNINLRIDGHSRNEKGNILNKSEKDSFEENPFLRKPTNQNSNNAIKVSGLNNHLEHLLRRDAQENFGTSPRDMTQPKYRELVSSIEEEIKSRNTRSQTDGSYRKDEGVNDSMFKRKSEPSLGSTDQENTHTSSKRGSDDMDIRTSEHDDTENDDILDTHPSFKSIAIFTR